MPQQEMGVADQVLGQARELLAPALRRGLLGSVTLGLIQTGCGGREPEICTFHPECAAAEGRLEADSLCEIGSVTKVYTSLLLATMVRRGLVRLDDPVSDYLPADFRTVHCWRPIRLLDLATHVSGLPARPPQTGRLWRNMDDPFAGYEQSDILAYLRERGLEISGDGSYAYSNVGYALLGIALETAGGAPFAEVMHRYVLVPLGLEQTFAAIGTEQKSLIPQGHTRVGRKTVSWQQTVFGPAGGAYATMADLLRFLDFFAQGTGPLAAEMDAVLAPRVKMSNGGDLGLAWWIEQAGGAPWYWHDGLTAGFSCYIGFSRSDRIVIAGISDRYGVEILRDFCRGIRGIVRGEPAKPLAGNYGMAHGYLEQGFIEFARVPWWVRAGVAGLGCGLVLWACQSLIAP